MYQYVSSPFAAGTVNVVVVSTMGDTIINDMNYFGISNGWWSFSLPLTQGVTPTDPADSIFISFLNSSEPCGGGGGGLSP